MSDLNRWIKYRFLRISIKAKWSRIKATKLTKVQDSTLRITMSLISNNNSELLMNPKIEDDFGEKYYIRKLNESGEIENFVTIGRTSIGYNVTLIGHEMMNGEKYNYHYDVFFNDECGGMIVDKFKRVLRRRRNKMESEIRQDDEKTLELILKNLEKNV